MPPITQSQLKRLRKLDTRHGRTKEGCFIVEGTRAVEAALQHGGRLAELLVATSAFLASPDWSRLRPLVESLNLEAQEISAAELAGLADTETPSGILCMMRYPESLADITGAPPDPVVLVLDRIQDPGNLGTMLRTAWAVGLTQVWLTTGCTDPFAPKGIRAGMGAQFALSLREFPSLEAVRACLLQYGYNNLWLAGPRGELTVFGEGYDPRRAGIVIGNEANGIQPDAPGTWVSIPMRGHAESLNAAQAATVFLFDAVRRGIL
jgi:TrmH family RNA methyltransferase